ncbi:sialate O-acetylesterase [Prosthecobacter fusiformis]|uniref:Sialate O-acetylesterase n=1 Tax=Prosthecobacter fusiformis TaxID=48464 RepID=A0A4R7SQW3_9BACT|nr:sialate O-acetylesterase [Prosthecobacter fusiformis]TDU81652.1 sialate O-acetylesterase [Prosthecobacter fusiformis]
MKFALSLTLFLSTLSLQAELRLPAIIGDHMVLQQKQANPIWGWDTPGTEVTVKFADQTKTAKAGADGKWTVKLDAVPASAKPATLSIQGTTGKELKNILVGEVWLCSGQSNMGFNVISSWDADLTIAQAKYPQIRLISVPQVGTQEIQDDFKGQWAECSPETVGQFTAVGYHYGRVLHEMLGVPVGLIDNAWGGSACEAWVRRDLLEKDARFKDIIERWKATEASFTQEAFDKQVADYKAKADAWALARKEAIKNGTPQPAPLGRAPRNAMTGQGRPGNLYAGVLHPTIGYGIKGVIWYQGESNASRAKEYQELFPFMIEHWRKEWKQGDFPFYWVQLADYKAENPEPGDSDWAELREAQTLSLSKVANSGQCVITDLGESNDIHPKNKVDVAERLARWALVKDYGLKMPYSSPTYKDVKFADGKAILTFDHAETGLRIVDVDQVRGFAICGEDRKWVWADAVILPDSKLSPRTPRGNQITVSSPQVAKPVAVRYAWADNPVANVYSAEGLPVTPFRTDDFPMITDPANPNGLQAQALKREEEIRTLQAQRAAAQKAKADAAKKKVP